MRNISRVLVSWAAASAAALSLPVAAKTAPLKPSSVWTVDYDTDSCALRRTFSDGKRNAYIELRRFSPGLRLQGIVASNMSSQRALRFRYRFSEGADWKEARTPLYLTLDNGFQGVLFSPRFVDLPEYEALEDLEQRDAYLKSIDWRTVEREAAAQTDQITLRSAFRRELSLHLGSLDKPITALNNCIDELMTHWGIDVEAHKTLIRPALPINLPEVPSMVSYPPKMLQRSMPGLVNIRLDIGETGKITGCHIQMPLSDPAFEESSCADIQHALEFEPALDKDGKPIPSYWVTRVMFQIGY